MIFPLVACAAPLLACSSDGGEASSAPSAVSGPDPSLDDARGGEVGPSSVADPGRPDDGVKNGSETDIDCGGADAGTPRCAVGKTCLVHGDCASDGCSDRGVCAVERSCTNLHGGETCGAGESGDAAASHESCCTSIEVPRADGSSVRLDKYKITAGRFRAFFERTGGDVRAAMAAQPAWDAEVEKIAPLPSNMDEALSQVGPAFQPWEWTSRDIFGAGGCAIATTGARTYWQNDNPKIAAAERHAYTREQEDEKIMNCATAALFRAFCLWDGGELATAADLDTAWGSQRWPWGAAPTVNAGQVALYSYDPRYVFGYNYGFPGDRPAGTDFSFYVPAPGRRSAGNGPLGHADVAGAAHEWSLLGDGGPVMYRNGSWEAHPMQKGAGPQASHRIWHRRYYAIGARCVRPAA